jgi:hypothetical protein
MRLPWPSKEESWSCWLKRTAYDFSLSLFNCLNTTFSSSISNYVRNNQILFYKNLFKKKTKDRERERERGR